MSARTVGSALLSVAGVLALAACTTAGGSDASGDCVIKVGSIFSQTGAASVFGSDGERAIDLAIKEINAEGFEVDGQECTIDYKAQDLASNPNNAAALSQDLINGFGAKFIFGPDMAAAVSPVATAVQRSGDVMLFSVSTGMDEYAGKGDPFFRLSPPDEAMVNEGYIPTVAEALEDVEKIAIVMTDDETGRAIAPSYTKALEASGVEVVQTEFYSADTTNFSPIVQRIDGDAVQGIFIGYNNDGAAASIMDASLEAGLPDVFITRGISVQPGIDRQDKLSDYTWLVLGADPLFPSTDAQEEFIDTFTSEYDVDPERMSYFPFVHYDYVGMLVQAMQEAGTTTDVDKISESLRGASYQGVVEVSFDEEGINTSPMGAGVFRDGSGEVIPF